jgi:flavin-dependent dehydrogenase
LNEIRRFELFANGRVAQISLRKPDLVIERSKLLNYLADNARQNGVKILTSHRFLDVKLDGHHLTLKVTPNGSAAVKKAAAQIIIGADGAFSRVASVCGWPRLKTVPLIQAVVKLPRDMPSDTTRVWFLPDDTPYFYWLIPHSPSEGVLGLIAEDMRRGRQSLERFIERKGLTPSFFQSAPVPIYDRWFPIHRRIGHGDVYLVGDAAGHVKATTVGGVVTGLRGALSVVDQILGKRNQQNMNILRRELYLHRLIRKVLNGFSQDDYVALFDQLNPSSVKTLGAYSRDEGIKLIFHLCLRRPKLLSIGLRKLLGNIAA